MHRNSKTAAMKLRGQRRHTNNHGFTGIKRGSCRAALAAIARKLGVPFK